MGAQLSSATRDVTGVLVGVLDSHPSYRASLAATLRRYQADADIPPGQALQWTSEKLCKDLCDPQLLQRPFADALSAASHSAASSLAGLDKAALSSCIGRAALLVLEELKLDLAVHQRLFDCAAAGKLDRVRRLEPFVDIDSTDAQGATVLMLAAHYGHGALVAYLLALQPPPAVDAQDQYGWTALMHAARNGHLSCVRLLTAQSASVNALNASRCSALMCAADNGHFAVVRHLLAQHADVDAVSRSGDTALLQAAKGGHLSILKALVAAGAHVSHVGKKQQSALMLAASQARWDIVEYLVSEGAAVDGVDDEGRSVCHYEVKPAFAQPLGHAAAAAARRVGRGAGAGGAASTGGGQLAAAMQRGIVGRFNRTIQRSVQASVAHRKLGAFHRQQLANASAQQLHSQRANQPSSPQAHDDISKQRQQGAATAESDTEQATGRQAEPANGRLTHRTRSGTANGAVEARSGADREGRGRRRRIEQRSSRSEQPATGSFFSAHGDGGANVSIGRVVLGEDDEDSEPPSVARATALSSASSVDDGAPTKAGLPVIVGNSHREDDDYSADRLSASHSAPRRLMATALSDLDSGIDSDDAQLLANSDTHGQHSPLSPEPNSDSQFRHPSQRRQQADASHVLHSPAANGAGARVRIKRPINPTPRQAAQHGSGYGGRPAAVDDEADVDGEPDSQPPTSTPTRADSGSHSHRRHRSISTSPQHSARTPRRSRPSTRSRLTALRQATFLPTSTAARALRRATEDVEHSARRDADDEVPEADGWMDDGIERRTAHPDTATDGRFPAAATSTRRGRSGSHHSIHQSPAPIRFQSKSPTAHTQRSHSSELESNSASPSSSSFNSSSSSSSSDSSHSSPSSHRRSPMRPLHCRSSTASFKSVFTARSQTSRSSSHAPPTLAAIDSVPLSPTSPSTACPALPQCGRTPTPTALTLAIHIAEPPARSPGAASNDSDNIHLNPTPQPSPLPQQPRHTAQQHPPATGELQPHLHLQVERSTHHRRAHSQPLTATSQSALYAQDAFDEQDGDVREQRTPRHQPSTDSDTSSVEDLPHRVPAASNDHPASELAKADDSTTANASSTPATCPLSPLLIERASQKEIDSPRPSPILVPAAVLAPVPAPSASSQPPPASATVASSAASSSLRAPPPIVIAHSDFRAHLDSTPVPAWLQHYRIEGAAYSALSQLSFRQLYSLTQDDCRRMLGRRKGEMLFACTREYGRKVKATYDNHDMAGRQQLVGDRAGRQQQPHQQQQQQQQHPQHPPQPPLPSPQWEVQSLSAHPPSHAGGVVRAAVSGGRSTSVRERPRRSGKGRKKSAVHTAVVVSPADIGEQQLVFIAPTTAALPSLAPPASPQHQSQPLASAHSQHSHSQQEAVAAAHHTDHTATQPANVSATAPPASPPDAALSAVRTVSVSPQPPPMPQSSSFVALTDQLLDRSNAWLTRSVLAMFKDQQQQQQQTSHQSQSAHSTAESGSGLSSSRLSFSSAKAHARLSSILSGAGVLHELEPQPF